MHATAAARRARLLVLDRWYMITTAAAAASRALHSLRGSPAANRQSRVSSGPAGPSATTSKAAAAAPLATPISLDLPGRLPRVARGP